jgi:hypothetical protein
MKKYKKAQLTIWFVFIITAIIVITLTAVIIPLGVRINTEFYKAGADLIAQSNASISSISDADVKSELQATFAGAMSSEQDNITVGTNIFQYSWIVVLVIISLVLFLYARRMVEVGPGGVV